MADNNTAAIPQPAGTDAPKPTEETLLGAADAKATSEDGTLLDQAGAEEKAAQLAEEKRILEADDRDLSTEERSKKAELVKAQEETKLADAAKAAAQAVPEKYEIKPPEGMSLDPTMMEKAAPLFKELKLSNEGAQKLANFYAETLKQMQQQQADGFKAFLENSKQETIKALGANYKQELAYAAKVRDRFLSTETVETLNAVGLANDVNLIKDLIKLGKLISEDKLVEGKRVIPDSEKSAAEVMYPDLSKK
jgi:succinate dehydrogenase flavin-adding protein (antitoxin of CptAB toxin-antitoxin module)